MKTDVTTYSMAEEVFVTFGNYELALTAEAARELALRLVQVTEETQTFVIEGEVNEMFDPDPDHNEEILVNAVGNYLDTQFHLDWGGDADWNQIEPGSGEPFCREAAGVAMAAIRQFVEDELEHGTITLDTYED